MSLALADQKPIPVRRGLRAIWAKPTTQVVMIGFCCFACPGMFNAVNGLGGGGQVDAGANNKGNIALNSTFAVTSFFSGTINNRLGSRLTLSLGSMGYALYIGAYLSYNINQSGSFIIAAGAILGICAGMLWTASGAMVLAYSTEQTKGKMFALFWAIFNLGAVLGNAIDFGLVYNSKANTVSNSTYAAFVAISGLGAFIPFLLTDPGTMVRDDGTRVVIPIHPSWYSELKGMWMILRLDLYIPLLFPMFLASNWFYTWQFNDFNGALFTLRTRALNAMLYYLFQVFGAGAFGYLMDLKMFRRRSRAWGGLAFVAVLVMAVWGGSYSFQKGYTRANICTAGTAGCVDPHTRIDFKTSGYAKYVVLYIWMGIMDSIWQNYAYWIMGAMSNEEPHLAYLIGFYKAIQSAGGAGVSAMDNNLVPYMTMLGVAWGLCMASLIFVLPLLHFRIQEHSETIGVVDQRQGSVETSSGEDMEKKVDA
ncbi:hypothetical protein RQP46_005119 [Phenoliferia psychrophenolica]